MITFPVSDVQPSSKPLPALDRDACLRGVLHKRLEALSPGTSRPFVLCSDAHPFALAAHDAFYQHYPLVISPDMIWFCLAQGFAHHVAANAEQLRERFVRHEGKKKLVVERPDFFLGQDNPWPEAFAAFSAQIAAHVGKLRDLLVADFSTTGPVERAAFEIVTMDTFQPYFEYEMRCGCGIPSITLLGTPDDWRSVRRRAAMLSEFGLEHWTRILLPVLDAIVRTAEGDVDRTFWRSFFRYESGSGPSLLTGWILTLFPYLRERKYERDRLDMKSRSTSERIVPNPHFTGWEKALRAAEDREAQRTRLSFQDAMGPALGSIPAGIGSAPVRFVDVRDGSEHMLRFTAGLFGVGQEATGGALVPEFGWAVLHDT